MANQNAILLLASCLALFFATVAGQPMPLREYTYNRTLNADPYFFIAWKFESGLLKLGVVCDSPGYCAIGFSKVGNMLNSDAIIGSIDQPAGTPRIIDYFLRNQVEPANGTCPNAVCPDVLTPGCTDGVLNPSGRRQGQYIVLEFDRSVAATDACDRPVSLDPLNKENLLWASGPGDANNVLRHTYRDYTTSGAGGWSWAPNVRTYYIAAEEVTWNYIPLRNPGPSKALYVDPSPSRIGSQYKKVVYKEYTSPAFDTPKFRTPDMLHTGILGPVIRGQVGDIIVVIFKNNVPSGGRNYTIRPHGILYDVTDENTSVGPGDNKTYTWFVPDRAGPGSSDLSSVLWLYHSDVVGEQDTNSGLVGPIIITRAGMATSETNLRPLDVNREFITLYTIFDENKSHYLTENKGSLTVSNTDPEFVESNRKRTINGYMFNNNDDFTMNVGEKVRWYVAGLGDVADIHVPHWHGQVVDAFGRRTDVLSLLPSEMVEVDMIADNAGSWNMHCEVLSHNDFGMNNMFTVSGSTPVTPIGQVRQYYIAAEEVTWNYAPKSPLPQGAAYVTNNATRIGASYAKLRYVEYEDATFTNPKQQPAEWAHTGILGPILRAEVGDTIQVKFRNSVNNGLSYSMYPHGLYYDSASEGTTGVAFGTTTDYVWTVPARSGPAAGMSSVMWLYTSHVQTTADANSGLVGAIIVTKQGSTKSTTDLSPDDVQKEFITVYSIFDENLSPLLDQNIAQYAPSADKSEPGFIESNKKHSINGLLFDNIVGLQMNVGENVRWYIASLGDEHDYHTPHWHAQTVTQYGVRKDVVSLLPSQMTEVDMTVDNPGVWNMHCHVNSHNSKGMNNKFVVNGTAAPFIPARDRVYYIAAEDVDWDYAPTNKPTAGNPWIQQSPTRIGSVYRKIRYVEYTDDTFTYKRGMSSRLFHKGILGPIIRAEVGDRIVVHFRNNVTSSARPLSMHPHSVFYAKESEGVATGVAPGQTAIYTWDVPARAGPAPGGPSSVVWLYHSHINSSADMNTGLVGAIVITRKGTARNADTDLMPTDVDREFFLLMNVFDENMSHLMNFNMGKLTQPVDRRDPAFVASNRKSAINGFIFSNAPRFLVQQNERVRWYLAALGDEGDVHSLSWDGLGATINGRRSDVVGLLPAVMLEADMVADNLGLWTAKCHVNTHSLAGMKIQVNVTVLVEDFVIPDEQGLIPTTDGELTESDDSDGFSLLWILIIAIGGFLILLLATLAIVFFVRRKHKKDVGGFY